MANEQNLQPLGKNSKLTKTEQRKIQSKGGKASAKARAEKKRRYETFKELGEMFLSLPIKEGALDEIKSIADVKGANITADEAMFFALLNKALKGDIKAIETMVELTGRKPLDNAPLPDNSGRKNSFIEALEGKTKEVWDDAE